MERNKDYSSIDNSSTYCKVRHKAIPQSFVVTTRHSLDTTHPKLSEQQVLVGPDDLSVLGPLSKALQVKQIGRPRLCLLGLRTAPQLLGLRNAFRGKAIYHLVALVQDHGKGGVGKVWGGNPS